MKVEFRGKYFYVYSGPQVASEIPAEEWVGYWKNIDETKRTEIIHAEAVTGLDLYPELLEVHMYMEGRKVPRMFKLATETAYQQVLQTFQSGLSFET